MNSHTPKQPGCSPRVFKWLLAGAVAITAFYVFSEHRVHVVLVLPYLLVLACPLMHLFMHRGHHRDGQHASPSENQSSRSGQSDGSARQ